MSTRKSKRISIKSKMNKDDESAFNDEPPIKRVKKTAKKSGKTVRDPVLGNHTNELHANSVNWTKTERAQIFLCHYCGYSCQRKYSISRHIQRVHQADTVKVERRIKELLICAICNQTCGNKTEMRKHIFKVHYMQYENSKSRLKKAYCCDICCEGFQDQRLLLAHRTTLHVDAASMKWSQFYASFCRVKRYNCCLKSFRFDKSGEHVCVVAETEESRKKIKLMLESKPLYRCDICSMCFQWKWIYRSHRESAHPYAKCEDWDSLNEINIPFYCLQCSNAFSDKECLEKHIPSCVADKGRKIKSFVCDLCGSSYFRKSDYRRHRRFKHSELEEEVAECDNSFRRKIPIQCPYCEVTTATRNGILEHIKKTHGIETDTPFVCIPCNKVFKRKATMDTHNQVYHPKEENVEETNKILKDAEILLNGETAYHCNICNRNMLNTVRFIAHYRLHYVERKFTCDLCGKQTRTQHQLNSHIKIIHLNIRNFECDICGKSFHAKQSCEEHRRIHTGERPFSCEICGKTFVAMNALLTHKKFHNDFYAHPCSMCPKKFKVRRSLINHIRTHTGERPFKCELCPKTFNNSSRFSYHKKVTHSDNRPFTCTQCGSCFKANKFLMRHMKLHNIRTHIQYRRRNNPAYFAAHGNVTKRSPSKKDDQQSCTYNDNNLLATAIYNVQRAFDGENAIQFNQNSNDIAAVGDCVIETTKSHFLAEAFGTNEEQLDFPTASSSGTRNSGRSPGNKHITCL